MTLPDSDETPLTLMLREPSSGVKVMLNRVAEKPENEPSGMHELSDVDWMTRRATAWCESDSSVVNSSRSCSVRVPECDSMLADVGWGGPRLRLDGGRDGGGGRLFEWRTSVWYGKRDSRPKERVVVAGRVVVAICMGNGGLWEKGQTCCDMKEGAVGLLLLALALYNTLG